MHTRTHMMAGILALLFAAVPLQAQNQPHDRAVFKESTNEFYDTLARKAEAFRQTPATPDRRLRVDLANVHAPATLPEFHPLWHQPPISQGLSGMCWCFSTTSFYESEIHRLTGREIKLSELYTVYWEYVEKAKRYVREHGNSEFGEGSEANAVPRIWRQYGVVPASAYTGMQPGQTVHDHRALFGDMRQYLESVKANHAWNEVEVIATIRAILDAALGAPPATVTVNGTTMTPQEYLAKVVRLNLDDYVEILSVLEKPVYTRVEYEVPDNWWHSKDYLNVPLDDFMRVVKASLQKGYSVCIGGDTSEPGLEGHTGVAFIPTFDIPAAYIDDAARQFRFSNRTTTDDHGIHLVGVTERDGLTWFLVKDSGSGSRNNTHPGYYFYREDYVKLKMMGFTVHRDMVKDLLQKETAQAGK